MRDVPAPEDVSGSLTPVDPGTVPVPTPRPASAGRARPESRASLSPSVRRDASWPTCRGGTGGD